MKMGKVPVNVLKRTVIRALEEENLNQETKYMDLLSKAGVGADAALLRLAVDEEIVVSTNVYECPHSQFAAMAVYKAVNNIASSFSVATAITVSFALPERFREIKLKEYMEKILAAARECRVQVVAGDTKTYNGVCVPILTITALGVKGPKEDNIKTEDDQIADCDLVVSKWIGMEGAYLIATEKEEELSERYPDSMIEAVKRLSQKISVLGEAATAGKSGVIAMHDLSEGGILGALYEFAQYHHVGLEVDIKKIPVKQEIIEICEYYGCNPYALRSGGSLLMAAKNGTKLVDDLKSQGICAAVIGRTTKSNDMVIYNAEEKRFLDRPQPDEIYEVLHR